MQWELYESRAYDRTAEWVFSSNQLQRDSGDIMIGIPSSIMENQTAVTTFFHCVGAKSSATFHANDVYFGAYFSTPLSSWEYSICQLDVYNPCRKNNSVDGKSYCVAQNSVVTCQAPPTTTSSTAPSTVSVQQARTSSTTSSTSNTMTLDSRNCPITTNQVHGPEEGEVPAEEEIENSTGANNCSTEDDHATQQFASAAVNTHDLSLLLCLSLTAAGFPAFFTV